ncbi:DedA family protein [Citricoccus sp. NR2]|uniref:DedA family protein n=1 Tax=Citricoccus sp. NR2 TaxID=3004095 RepID=UPI0022DD13B6|nr:VTT domain-containing protein [Citricoccus sp. NR2]WBL19918.1 VTT domain-containing protein [Citricoccus sp. NR2]
MNPLNWNMPLVWVWLALFCIVFARAGATYVVGRLVRRGAARFERAEKLLASPSYLTAEARINRWGAPVVAVSFLTIGFQTLANLSAGATRMSAWRYLPALVVGGAAWATIYSTIGFVGFEAVSRAYARWPVGTVVFGVAVLVALVLLVTVRRLRRPVGSLERAGAEVSDAVESPT